MLCLTAALGIIYSCLAWIRRAVKLGVHSIFVIEGTFILVMVDSVLPSIMIAEWRNAVVTVVNSLPVFRLLVSALVSFMKLSLPWL